MLASTVQFSTNNQTPPPGGPAEPRRPQTTSGTRPEMVLTKTRTQPPHGGGPFLQDPTACLQPPDTPRPASTQPRRAAVLGAGKTPAAELVSVPPSSTAPNTRGHPVVGDH